MNALIAIVDDEPDIVELVSINLKKASFRVKEFSDAESFFRSLSTETPDLVILDLMLPDMDGFEVCRSLRNQEKVREHSDNHAHGKGGRNGQSLGARTWGR